MPGAAAEKRVQGPTMAARGPHPALSISSHLHGGGSGGGGGGRGPNSSSSRTRGRNRSADSSGPSSREHSAEGRSDGGREGVLSRGSGDFAAGEYHAASTGESERVRWVQQQQRPPQAAPDTLAPISAGRAGGHNWASEGGGGGSNTDGRWRSSRGMDQGRVQGVFYHDSPVAVESSTRGYVLKIADQARREGRGGGGVGGSSNGLHTRQDVHGHLNHRREESFHGVNHRQENGDHDVGGYEGRWTRNASQSADGSSRLRRESSSERGGGGGLWILPGRDSSKEAAFGDARELQAFGSPGGLRRTVKATGSFLSPRDHPKFQQGRMIEGSSSRDVRDSSWEAFTKGDFRRNSGNEDVDRGEGPRVLSSGSKGHQLEDSSRTIAEKIRSDSNEMGSKAKDQFQSIRGGDRGVRVPDNADDAFKISSSSSPSIRNAMFSSASNLEARQNASGELPALSPSSSSNGSLGRKSSRGREQKRQDPAELPVFSPSAEPKRDGSLDDVTHETSVSQSAFKDSTLEADEERASAAAKQHLLSGKGWESASAGMHRTRSTDWYEICLREEEEEELRALSDKKREEESAQSTDRSLNPLKARRSRGTRRRDHRRQESDVFSPDSARPDATALERPWAVRGISGDTAQLTVSATQGNTDSGVTQSFFTPWNVLQQQPPVPNVRKAPQSAPVPKSLLQQFEQSSLEPPRNSPVRRENLNLRISIAGGRQAAGRAKRVVTNVDADQIENWREPRSASRDHSNDGVRPGSAQDAASSRSEQGTPERTDGSSSLVLSSSKEAEKNESAVGMQKANEAVRPTALYRTLDVATAADDEELPHIVGTCPDMCPARERLQRERLRDLAVFERLGGDMKRTSKELAVKKFCRTVVASELEASDVRPLPVLWRTQQYLLALLDDPEFSFDIVHNFLFDRTRAIRQELGMQRIANPQTVTMLEEIVRFHILSEHELCELNRKRSKQLDTHLNLQQLSKSLYDLLNLYISLGGDGNGGVPFPNEGEFYAYYVLLNLASHGQFQSEPLSLWFPSVPSRVRGSSSMKFAREALRLYRINNFTGIFRLVRKATYLQACLLELNFDSIRASALAILNTAEYKLHPYPLSDLAAQLILEENEVDELCTFYGLVTGVDNASQKLCLLPKQGHFSASEKDNRPQHGCPSIDRIRAASFFLEVKGGGRAD